MSNILRTLPQRALHATRRPTPALASASPTIRHYAAESHTPRPHNPKASPGSDSPTEAGVKSSRATDRGPDVKGGSTQQPVSGEDRAGTSEEGGDPAKAGDSGTPDEVKRKRVEGMGDTPLDPGQK